MEKRERLGEWEASMVLHRKERERKKGQGEGKKEAVGVKRDRKG